MNRFLRPLFLVAAAMTFPAAAQTPPTTSPAQAWPANRPPAPPPQAQPAPPAQPAGQPQAQQQQTPAPPQAPALNPNAPVPLPSWFSEIDTAKKGEVSRADFLKYRMKTFDQLDTNKDGKLSLEEFLKVAEPPFTADGPNVPSVEDRRTRARAEFQNLDTNRDGFVERPEAEAIVHAEFNQYDTDRDNKVTEAEMRRIVQVALQREDQVRREQEAQKRKGLVAINEFIDMQLRSADQLDKNGDGRISQQEYVALAGPADGPQAQGLPPFDLRRKVVMVKFTDIDTNKDGVLDRVELTAFAVNQFLQMDLNKDRFLNEEEFKKAQEAEQAKLKALVQTLMPAQQAPRPAPAQPRGGQPAPPQPQPPQPQGLAPGLPQGTR